MCPASVLCEKLGRPPALAGRIGLSGLQFGMRRRVGAAVSSHRRQCHSRIHTCRHTCTRRSPQTLEAKSKAQSRRRNHKVSAGCRHAFWPSSSSAASGLHSPGGDLRGPGGACARRRPNSPSHTFGCRGCERARHHLLVGVGAGTPPQPLRLWLHSPPSR